MAEASISGSRKPFDYSTPRECRKCGNVFSGRGCQNCHNAARRARRAYDPEKQRARDAEYRAKNRERINAREAERRRLNPQSYLRAKRKYNALNAEKIRLASSEYRRLNREQVLARAAAIRALPESKEKKRERAKNYRARFPEKVREQYERWAAANPEANRMRVAKRRALKTRAQGVVSKNIVARLLKLQRGKCACCGLPLGSTYQLDHIVPLARGGAHADSNLQLLRKPCNAQKHATDPIDFMQRKGYLL